MCVCFQNTSMTLTALQHIIVMLFQFVAADTAFT